MVTVEMNADSESLLRQVAADLDVSVEETARIMLESALLSSLTR
jgi:hypothetical protein